MDPAKLYKVALGLLISIYGALHPVRGEMFIAFGAQKELLRSQERNSYGRERLN